MLGCGSTSDAAPPPSNDAAVDAVADVPIADVAPEVAVDTGPAVPFTLCPSGYTGACATFDAPLDHDVPGGKTIKLLASRIASTPGATAQVWVLQGGPGASAVDMTQIGLEFARGVPKLDVYTLEHRGVGASDRLGCKDEPMTEDPAVALAFWKSCAAELETKWGKDGLAKFNTTQAARDLGWVIDRVRKPGQKVFVYGVSYGTYWAQRYLQVRDEQPDAVILDSVVPPGIQFLSKFDAQYDGVLLKLAEHCKTDTTCKTHLGDDPFATVKSLVAKVRAGTCATGLPKETIFAGARILMQAGGADVLALPLLYRYGRCSSGDVAAIKKLAATLKMFVPGPRFSQALFFNVALSELWETPGPPREELVARSEAAMLGGEAPQISDVREFWPLYPPDKYVGVVPTTKKPVLLLNGTWDVQTPIELAEKMKDFFVAPGQSFVTFPFGNHTAFMNTPTTKDEQCGQLVSFSFLAKGTPDTTCLKNLVVPTFSPDPGMVSFFFGRADAWDEMGGAPMASAPSLPANIERALRDAVARGGVRLR